MLRLLPPPSASPPTREARANADAVAALLGPFSDVTRPLIIVPDRTRDVALQTWAPLLVDELRARGATEVRFLFASGTHRPMSQSERDLALGPTANDVKHESHDCDAKMFDFGGGHLNYALADSTAVVLLSVLSLHYLAGVGGGRKMLIPGVASRELAVGVHATTISASGPGRPASVTPGKLTGNPMHEAIMERIRVSKLPPIRSLVVVMRDGAIEDAHVGDLERSFSDRARAFVDERTVVVDDLLQAVEIDVPPPSDIDLVQAHKSIVALAPILAPKARVLVRASLTAGLGHDDMAAWIAQDAATQLRQLRSAFSIGRQTAWSIRSLCEAFEIAFVDLRFPASTTAALEGAGARVLSTIEAESWLHRGGARSAHAPAGAKFRYLVQSSTDES